MYEIKVENKNIIITDPCYLKNVMHAEDKTVGLHDYWDKFLGLMYGECDGGDILKKFDFNDNIACSTKYGDWSCTVYKVDKDPRELKSVEDLNNLLLKMKPSDEVGVFCANAGMVCVVDSDDLKRFNPHFFEWALFHKHCVTSIPNFTGTIGIHDIDPKWKELPNGRIRVVYGIADKEKNKYGYNFCSLQTGY